MSDSWIDYLLNDLPMSYLSGITSGGSDEALAAITGFTTGKGYDSELAGIRDEMKRFKETNPQSALGGEILGGLVQSAAMAPVAAAGKAKSILGAALSAAKSGAGQGLVQGFLDGEGSALNRLDRSADNAIGGAMFGGALGAAGSKIGAKQVENAGDDLMRSSFGFTANDYAKAMRGPGEQTLRTEGKSALSNIVSRLRKDGTLNRNILKDPESFSMALDSKISGLAKQLKDTLDIVDGSGVVMKVTPQTFQNTLDGINQNMSGKAKQEALAIFGKETEALLKDGAPTLAAANKMKQNIQSDVSSAYARANPTMGDEIKMGLASDLRKHIESEANQAAQLGFVPQAVDGQVKGLNQKMSDIFAIKPTVEKNIAKGETSNLLNSFISATKTTGGAGATAYLAATLGSPALAALAGTVGTMAISPMARYNVGDAMGSAARYLRDNSANANIDPIFPNLIRNSTTANAGALRGKLGSLIADQYSQVGLDNGQSQTPTDAEKILKAILGK
jgi:hypothetical protein